MTIEQTIKKAIEGGWEKKIIKNYKYEIFGKVCIDFFDKETGAKVMVIQIAEVFLDPDFWKCLGKAMGWKKIMSKELVCFNDDVWLEEWKYRWHKFIDALADGKTPTQFFGGLKDNQKGI